MPDDIDHNDRTRTASISDCDIMGILREQLTVLQQILARMPVEKARTPNDKVMTAILLLAEVGPNIAEIARRVKCNRTTMYRSPKWSKFRDFLSEFQAKIDPPAKNSEND